MAEQEEAQKKGLGPYLCNPDCNVRKLLRSPRYAVVEGKIDDK